MGLYRLIGGLGDDWPGRLSSDSQASGTSIACHSSFRHKKLSLDNHFEGHEYYWSVKLNNQFLFRQFELSSKRHLGVSSGNSLTGCESGRTGLASRVK